MRRLAALAACWALLALLLAPAARAGSLEAFNRQVFAFNQGLAEGVDALRGRMPELPRLPEAWRDGSANLVSTWIGQPWQAAALALAGRERDALLALRRAGVNIAEGSGGWRDAATQQGLARPPAADLGLALCARGVPAGPYIVFPLLGGRTLRDGVTDLLVANLLVYLASIPFLGPVPSIELLIAVEVLDSVPAWLIARELDSVGAAEPQGMAMEAAREGYLRARAEACAALRAPWSVNDGARVDNAGQPVLQR